MPESAPCGLYRQLKNTAPQQGGVFFMAPLYLPDVLRRTGRDSLSGRYYTTRVPETTGFVSKTG